VVGVCWHQDRCRGAAESQQPTDAGEAQRQTYKIASNYRPLPRTWLRRSGSWPTAMPILRSGMPTTGGHGMERRGMPGVRHGAWHSLSGTRSWSQLPSCAPPPQVPNPWPHGGLATLADYQRPKGGRWALSLVLLPDPHPISYQHGPAPRPRSRLTMGATEVDLECVYAHFLAAAHNLLPRVPEGRWRGGARASTLRARGFGGAACGLSMLVQV
jgi:hypothetical protein